MSANIKRIISMLEKAYGIPTIERFDDPLDELILTILSQNTSDVNSDRAFESLRQRFPRWELAMRANPGQIAEAIRIGGLANIKSVRIKEILQQIYLKTGKLSLKFLRQMPVQEAKEFLSSFKGVGPKTVACVLLFACDMPAFPVDTHIKRIGGRTGWWPEGVTDEKAHQIMERIVPPEKYLSFHINLIRHGRQICRAQAPKCQICCIARHCNYYLSRTRQKSALKRSGGVA